ncbi:hypothetical protein EDD18DRAFT_1111260 [Armillaria luteobubalina]|uniref:Uncharacterized protein n=1 Tax=Armillaria luteobubalina TaxID=153913 RepID=A0AA39UJM6_9AGAR|nr:hypothetical protein EDD18DRAFT_1111260 [Armillaria luteobubalina]
MIQPSMLVLLFHMPLTLHCLREKGIVILVIHIKYYTFIVTMVPEYPHIDKIYLSLCSTLAVAWFYPNYGASIHLQISEQESYWYTAQKGQSVGPFDGRLGMLIDKEWPIITPNRSGLYQPPLGINQEMYMWADFKYSANDPLLWPQFYVHSDPWLSCI